MNYGRRFRVCALALAALVLSACDPVEEIREHFEATTPREAYEHALRTAGLDGTALVREWTDAAERALDAPVPVAAPFSETGYLAPERPAALGYRVPVRRGQRVSIAMRMSGDTAALLFLDVHRAPRDTLEQPDHMTSADSGAHALEFEPRRDGEYIIRIQPELLRGGGYTLEIRNEPMLAFPVSGGGNGNIQSIFGDPRDGGARNHHGVDIFAPRGTPVVAAVAGTVYRVNETPRGGRVVWLRDERRGYRFYYAHLDRQLVANGASVEPGDTLGVVGNTGNARTTPPHLHFGVYMRGEGPIDPMPFVRRIATTPPALAVDTALIGGWTRTARDETRVRVSPSAQAEPIAELPRHTALLVMAGAGDWYRVALPDGRVGFVVARLVEEAERPLRREVLAAAQPVRLQPSPAAVAIASIPAGQPVDVLGRFGEFLYVQAGAGLAGWVAQD
jgi:murein DD-endopeptidase MepM/ murein hydrolase activator NlpD